MSRRAGIKVHMVALALLAAVCAALQPGCARSASAEAQVDRLLTQYDLHAVGAPTVTTQRLGDPGELAYALYCDTSSSIGLDLEPFAGKNVQFWSYVLEERSQSTEGEISACFIVDDDAVVGAFLSLDGYIPNISALNERWNFAVPGLSPDNLDFDAVTSVGLSGPWAQDDWENQATLSGQDMEDLLALITSSTKVAGERLAVLEDEEYAITLTYDNGAQVVARLTTSSDTGETVLTFDSAPFLNWHYLPPSELKERVKSALGVDRSAD